VPLKVEAVQEIRESQEKFKRLFMDNPEACVYVDSDFRIVDINPRFTELFGYTLEEIKGKHIDEVIVPEDKINEAKVINQKALEGPFYWETVRRRKDGSLVPVSISIAPIKLEGKLIGTIGLYRDITERKRYEERLSALHFYGQSLNKAKSMEEIYRLTLDAMEKVLEFKYADILMVEGDVLRVVDCRGYPQFISLELPLDGSKGGITVRAVKTGKSIFVPDVRKDKDFVGVQSGILSELAVPIKIGDRVLGVLNVESKKLAAFNEKDRELLEILASHAATAISNLEHAKKLEKYALEIKASREKFEMLFRNNPEAAVYVDPNFHIIDINPRFTELFGYTLDEIKGKHIDDIVVPKELIKEGRMLGRKGEKGYTYHDSVRMRKGGMLIPVSISGAPIIVEGKLIGSVWIYKDISHLKKIEKELRDTLEKLRVVGKLTRHDVRNKLSVVAGSVYLIKKRLGGNIEVLKYLDEIEKAIGQIERIFNFAATYEMLGVEELVYIDVEKTVQEATSLFSDLKGAKVINKCKSLVVLADSLLRQVFYNLIDNSLKYGKKVREIKVYYQKIDDGKLKLIYEDDGIGIPKREKELIFREGYGKGTGYGLYLIKKICEGYEWTIEETGKYGKGAQFTMTIPRVNRIGKICWKLNNVTNWQQLNMLTFKTYGATHLSADQVS